MVNSLNYGPTLDVSQWHSNFNAYTEAVHQQAYLQPGIFLNTDSDGDQDVSQSPSSFQRSTQEDQPAPGIRCPHDGCRRSFPTRKSLMMHLWWHTSKENPPSDPLETSAIVDNFGNLDLPSSFSDVSTPEDGQENAVNLFLQKYKKRKDGPKVKHSAFTIREQAEFDALPPPPESVPNRGYIARSVVVGNEVKKEITWFHPKVSPTSSLSNGERLYLVCQNRCPDTKYSNPFRCVYVDPWEFNLCGKVYSKHSAWEKHFQDHASREQYLVDIGICQFKDCVALKDPRLQDKQHWTPMCPTIGSTQCTDSLKRHMIGQHGTDPGHARMKRVHDSLDAGTSTGEPSSKKARRR